MSTDQTPKITDRPQNITKSPQWRVLYSNITGLVASDNDVHLHFGIDQDPAKAGSDVLEESIVVLTLRSAKTLSYALSALIERIEATHGHIPVSEKMMKAIDDAVDRSSGNPVKKKQEEAAN